MGHPFIGLFPSQDQQVKAAYIESWAQWVVEVLLLDGAVREGCHLPNAFAVATPVSVRVKGDRCQALGCCLTLTLSIAS